MSLINPQSKPKYDGNEEESVVSPSPNSHDVTTRTLPREPNAAAKSNSEEVNMTQAEKRSEAINAILNGGEYEYERILGVSSTEGENVKARVWKQKISLVHPDLNNNSYKAGQATAWLNRAFRVLGNLSEERFQEGLDDISAQWHNSAFDDDNDDVEEDPGDDDPECDSKTSTDRATPVQKKAPSEIEQIYAKATSDVLRLLQFNDLSALEGVSEAEEQISKYYDTLGSGQGSRDFSLVPSILQVTAQGYAEIKASLGKKNTPEIFERYQKYQDTLECHARQFGWPSTWRLPQLESQELELEAFYKQATKYIYVLKENTHDENSIRGLEVLNDQIEDYAEQNDLMDYPTINFPKLCHYYGELKQYFQKLSPSNDAKARIEALRKAETIRDELERYCVSRGYPRDWILEIPDSLTKSSPLENKLAGLYKVRTREGYPIIGYRTWGSGRKSYLFAVLPNDDTPIGVLLPGRIIGKDTRESFEKLEQKVEFHPRGTKDSNNGRDYKVKAAFVHIRKNDSERAPETWVLLFCTKTENFSFMTLSAWHSFRSGVDAYYDVLKLYQENDLSAPDHITKRLPNQLTLPITKSPQPVQSSHVKPNTTSRFSLPTAAEAARNRDPESAELDRIMDVLRNGNKEEPNTKLTLEERTKRIKELEMELQSLRVGQ
ncbi:uncharacterized protein BP01DRAFT_361094 [Aspergillus saccharolyticus JOP 1030-1]|uniref:J domain-containing protein n=1 Tax=Aspergillus saccharolyticus JOP 1030-1 TaxID=1450539 RepID=A0A318Z102_9EURO|nr:hypothetical protein BP01DRAFT_361094 [Aspergillus saccharolyticus JOP 1030-1]PYH40589.1 hypothetical protein BP01DRAFT_361094 [Aspergillus saccharolyticus JOP 1030-1]